MMIEMSKNPYPPIVRTVLAGLKIGTAFLNTVLGVLRALMFCKNSMLDFRVFPFHDANCFCICEAQDCSS